MSSVDKGVSGVNWEILLKKTILYASGHINRWYWRGTLRGVLPCGFDPNSLAAEAISEFLQNPDRHNLATDEIQRDLERRVRRHVNRLHHRSENRLTRNEPDLFPVALDDGETVSVIELIQEPSIPPDAVLLQKDSLDQFARFKTRFSQFLSSDRQLRTVLALYCDDCSKLNDLASRLKLNPVIVKNLQRRFRRKWSQFHRCDSPSTHGVPSPWGRGPG